MSDYIDEQAFLSARDIILAGRHDDNGIGTLSERSVHGILKYYYEPDKDCQEVALEGYVADIFKNGCVTEIQTGNFDKMRNKLSVFLNLYEVRIVYPIPHIKYLTVIDKTTGERISRRKSPKRGKAYDAFYELYKIKEYLNNPHLSIEIVMLDIEEYRVYTGKKHKHSTSEKYDRVPDGIAEIVRIDSIEDYIQLLPVDLPEYFTSKDYMKSAGITYTLANRALNIMTFLGIVTKEGKNGRLNLYHAKDV